MAPNIERHPMHKGQYVAYDARGFAFRVAKSGADGWRGAPSHAGKATDHRVFYAPTLARIADRIGASSPR